ncbi:cache domain-containing sensor histidine kinase [Paenibacillus rigui]|nr:sensor histidine kinase [Paenibacillus rigui]
MRLARWFPSTLKNKLTLAFLLLILVPFSILNYYNFAKMESVLRVKISEQSQEELNRMNKAFEEIITITNRTFTLLEQDPNISDMLRNPGKYDAYDTQANLENKFKAITNSIFLTSPRVYYTVLDRKGHYYTSYKPLEPLDYNRLSQEDWFQEGKEAKGAFRWYLEKNYVHKDESPNPRLLSVYGNFRQADGSAFAVVRISIDYLDWFRSITYGTSEDKQYFLVDANRQLIAQSTDAPLDLSELNVPLSSHTESGYGMDSSYIMNYSYVPWLDWYFLKRVPKDIVYAEIDKLKASFFISFLIFTLTFIGITFLIASATTRPLKQLQLKMQSVVRKNLKVYLPEEGYRGEILELSQTFNQMVGDMNDLVQRLKKEERQKEAVHFQMLLSQTNPHFLLNTLNTIKWIALGKGDEEVAEICVSLGRLLEASLNSEVELLHLKDEIELVEAYVYIQNFRYKQSFVVHYDVDPALEFALVPKLSLQLLVENSIQHGLSGKQGEGQIWIRAYPREASLVVEVEDNGIGLAEAELQKNRSGRKRSGIGLSNLKERLALLFKDQAGMLVQSMEAGTMVQYHLPLLLSKPYGKE